MYRLLFVDDEQIAWEGMASCTDWTALGISLSFARNGKDAYDMIMREPPDIVITDIRMPFMDGVSLVREVRKENQTLPFIILSGHDEFSYAQETMRYNVQHYLLKPASPAEISKTLEKVIAEIENEREQKNRQEQTRALLDRMKPQLMEQFLCTICLVSYDADDPEQEAMKNMLGIDNGTPYLAALFEPDSNQSFRNVFLLKEIVKDLIIKWPVLCKDDFFIITVVENCVLLLTKTAERKHLISFIERVQTEYSQCTGVSFTSAFMLDTCFEDIGQIYSKLKYGVQYRFYLGNGSIIASDEIPDVIGEVESGFSYEYEQITLAAGSGNLEKTEQLLLSCFDVWRNRNIPVRMLKFYCLELLSHVINKTKAEPDATRSYITLMFDGGDAQETVFERTREVIMSVGAQKYEYNKNRTYDIVKKVLNYVHEHYRDEDLSLSWIAKNVVFLNVDYVGRLFKKEMDKNFNPYLCELRIDRAKALLRQNPKYSIADVAQQVGLCKNPQYFANLFKQHVGMTPRMYKLQFQEGGTVTS